jgi:hypothetical protein
MSASLAKAYRDSPHASVRPSFDRLCERRTGDLNNLATAKPDRQMRAEQNGWTISKIRAALVLSAVYSVALGSQGEWEMQAAPEASAAAPNSERAAELCSTQ